ncbi:sugar MFS transporter [Fructilactobacillus sp. Tb1]|uniref:sugar MFS transporter n=1 Tax=Fructilactobacillus sp. Tb1 TaxID=3422304 RepID=UPI003D2B60D5
MQPANQSFGFLKFKGKQLDSGYLSKTPIVQFLLVSALFPMWGAAQSLNDILITQFKAIFHLSYLASAYVQSSFFLGYFLTAILASYLIKKTSYKFTIIVGLTLYLTGCILFFPASQSATYAYFLLALFVLATGLSFLETSADTFSSLLGPENNRVLRLNIAQTFNPIGAVAGILLGKYLIFGNGPDLADQLKHASAVKQVALAEAALHRTLLPYRYMIIVLILLLIGFCVIQFPKCKPITTEKADPLWKTVMDLLKNHKFTFGMFTQFMYMGLQVGVWSFTIQLALHLNKSISDSQASNFVIMSYIAFFIGRLSADKLMQKIKPLKVFMAYSILALLGIIFIVLEHGFISVYAAILVSGFMGPCYATIYSTSIGFVTNPHQRETAGALMVMMIIGGGIWPLVQGFAADVTGSMSLSFGVQIITLAVMILFAVFNLKTVQK